MDPEYTQTGGAQWYDASKERIAAVVSALVRQLWDADSPRRVEVEKNVRRFGWRNLHGLAQAASGSTDRNNLRINLTKATIETISAKVGKNRPKPTLLTYGGDHSLQIRVKKLQRWLDGVYYAADVYKTTGNVFRDAMLTGSGVWHFFAHPGKKKLCLERVFPLEMLVDEVDGHNGDPRCVYRVKFLDKDTLTAMFPAKKRAIQALQCLPAEALPDFLPIRPTSPQAHRMVLVSEAWKRAETSFDGEVMPGKHVIAAGEVLLHCDDYGCDTFPFEFFHWCEPVTGFWGDSAAAEIRGLETECNRLLQSAQKAMDLVGKPWILNPTGDEVKPGKFTNDTALIVNYNPGSGKPEVMSFQAVHPQILAQAWDLRRIAFETLGTNEYQASAVKPPGVEAGVALRQLSEEHIVRFSIVTQNFERVVTRGFTAQFMRLAAELDETLKSRGESEGYVLRAVAGKSGVKFKWSDVAMAPDEFFAQCWPTSILPNTPSGKTAAVKEWQESGWVNPDQAKRLLDFPDLDAVADIAGADQDLLDQQLDDMLENGKDVLPLDRQDLQKALTWGTLRLEKAVHDGAPPEAQDRVNAFLNAVEQQIAAAVPPPAPQLMPTAPGAAAVGLAPQGPVDPAAIASLGKMTGTLPSM